MPQESEEQQTEKDEEAVERHVAAQAVPTMSSLPPPTRIREAKDERVPVPMPFVFRVNGSKERVHRALDEASEARYIAHGSADGDARKVLATLGVALAMVEDHATAHNESLDVQVSVAKLASSVTVTPKIVTLHEDFKSLAEAEQFSSTQIDETSLVEA